MGFGNRLYELRKKAGMSQEELAAALDVTRQTVSKWEVGDSTPELMKLIALGDLFGVSLDYLALGKTAEASASENPAGKILTKENGKRLKTGLRWALLGAGVVLAIDAVSLLVCILLGYFPG